MMVEDEEEERWRRPLLPCLRRLHQWKSTLRMLLPCLRRLHQWISTSRLLLPFLRRLHQWKSTLRMLLPCLRGQHQWWSTPHAPAVSAAPAPLEEYIAPSPAVFAGASTSGRVHLAFSCRVRGASTSGSLHRARSCRVCGASTSGRVHRAPLLLCTRHKRQVGISHLRQLCFVLEVFKALSQDRVPPLVVEMPFLFRLVGDVWRMRMAVCTIGMCTRARRSLRLQRRMTRRTRRTRRRTKTWTSWMIHSLVPAHADVPVVPLRELPAGVGVYVRSLCERAAPPSSWSRAVTSFYGPLYLAVTCSLRRLTSAWLGFSGR